MIFPTKKWEFAVEFGVERVPQPRMQSSPPGHYSFSFGNPKINLNSFATGILGGGVDSTQIVFWLEDVSWKETNILATRDICQLETMFIQHHTTCFGRKGKKVTCNSQFYDLTSVLRCFLGMKRGK